MAFFNKRYAASGGFSRKSPKSKFHNCKSEQDGVSFDSKIELNIYNEMVGMVGTLIKSVTPHPKAIERLSTVEKELTSGEKYSIRGVKYNPDILFVDFDDVPHYIDVKSWVTVTPDFILKFKMCLALNNIYINIITREVWKGTETIESIIRGDFKSHLTKKSAEKDKPS